MISAQDAGFLDRVHEMALAAEAKGNLPIAAILARGGAQISEGENRSMAPRFHPGRHAEMEALHAAPDDIWEFAGELTVYTSLEPCLMCFGTIILHRIGRVVFGAFDVRGGALSVLPHLPPYVRANAQSILWEGPVQPDRFGPLARRALALHWGTPGKR